MKGFAFYRIVKAAGFLLQKPLQTQRSILIYQMKSRFIVSELTSAHAMKTLPASAGRLPNLMQIDEPQLSLRFLAVIQIERGCLVFAPVLVQSCDI